MKRIPCLFILIALTILICSAQAENAPASQFGFHGWPYRQNVCANKSGACCSAIRARRRPSGGCAAGHRTSCRKHG